MKFMWKRGYSKAFKNRPKAKKKAVYEKNIIWNAEKAIDL